MVFIKRIWLEMVCRFSSIDFAFAHSIHFTFCADLANRPLTELNDGWTWLNRKRDDIDYEWEAFKVHTTKYVYWLICHALLTEIVRFVAPKVLSHSSKKFRNVPFQRVSLFIFV